MMDDSKFLEFCCADLYHGFLNRDFAAFMFVQFVCVCVCMYVCGMYRIYVRTSVSFGLDNILATI